MRRVMSNPNPDCNHNHNYTVRQKKELIFFCVHLFSTWQKLVNLSLYKLQFRVHNFGMRWEFWRDNDIKHFIFTSQVMKLMTNGQC